MAFLQLSPPFQMYTIWLIRCVPYTFRSRDSYCTYGSVKEIYNLANSPCSFYFLFKRFLLHIRARKGDYIVFLQLSPPFQMYTIYLIRRVLFTFCSQDFQCP